MPEIVRKIRECQGTSFTPARNAVVAGVPAARGDIDRATAQKAAIGAAPGAAVPCKGVTMVT